MADDEDVALPPEHPLIGHVLGGSYRIVGVIDRGGMGAVLEAVHLRLEQSLAIKVLRNGFGRKEAHLRRFYQEAVFVSQLRHPHVVQVIDFDVTSDGLPYIVMERLIGETLEQRLAGARTLSLGEVIALAQQIASPLAASHAAGVVHRDLKPGNIFLQQVTGEDDFVKLLDFGISKRITEARRITGEHELLGTPAYMAPEQIDERFGLLDGRSDQFALGVLVWEMLTGAVPFHGGGASAVLRAITDDPTPVLSHHSGRVFPKELDAVLARALAKQSSERFSSVLAFVRALESASPLERRKARHVADAIPVRSPELAETKAEETKAEETKAEETGLGATTSSEALLLARLGGSDRSIHRTRLPSTEDAFMCPVLAFIASRLDEDLTVGDVLAMSPYDELETLQALQDLARQGIVHGLSLSS